MTRTLLIVWHSRTGAAWQMAQAAAQGARNVADTLAADGDSNEVADHDGPHNDALGCDTTGEPILDRAKTSHLRIIMRHALQASMQDMLQADGFIFCAPENLGTLSGEMKTFFDRRYYDVLDKIAGRPYALIITAGSDGAGAARQATRICTGWRLRPVAEPLIERFDAQTAATILAPKSLDDQKRASAFELGGLAAGTLLLGG